MEPVQPVTHTKWTRYKQIPWNAYSPNKQTEMVDCTFEEALEKANRERLLIEANDRKMTRR